MRILKKVCTNIYKQGESTMEMLREMKIIFELEWEMCWNAFASWQTKNWACKTFQFWAHKMYMLQNVWLSSLYQICCILDQKQSFYEFIMMAMKCRKTTTPHWNELFHVSENWHPKTCISCDRNNYCLFLPLVTKSHLQSNVSQKPRIFPKSTNTMSATL